MMMWFLGYQLYLEGAKQTVPDLPLLPCLLPKACQRNSLGFRV